MNHSIGVIFPALLLLALALPAGVFSTYLATLRRMHSLSVWSAASLPVRWLSRPWLRIVIGTLVAIASSLVLVARGATFAVRDGMMLVLCIALFLVISFHLACKLRPQLAPAYRFGWPLWVGCWITAALVAVVDVGVYALILRSDSFIDVPEAIKSIDGAGAWLGNSQIASLITHVAVTWAGAERHVLSQFNGGEGVFVILFLLLVFAGRFAFHFFVCLSVAALCVPAREQFGRILSPPVAVDSPPTVPASRIALAAGLFSLLVGFAYLPLVAMIERISTEHQARTQEVADTVRLSVERIGDTLVKPGTIAKAKELTRERIASQEELAQNVAAEMDRGFDLMRQNVVLYLDWYYGLGAEYLRLGNLLMGRFEAHLRQELERTLQQGDPFANAKRAYDRALVHDQELHDEHKASLKRLIDENRIEPPPGQEIITLESIDPSQIIGTADDVGLTSVGQRFGLSGGAGVAGAFIARQVVMKVVARGTLRSAASAMVRLGGARLAAAVGGAGTGAMTGGAAGSAVPGLGTAAGAVVGGLVGGIVVGVSADYAMLKLEEAFRRQAHRDQLLGAIDEYQREFHESLAGATLKPKTSDESK